MSVGSVLFLNIMHILAYPLGHLKHFYDQTLKITRRLPGVLPVGMRGILVVDVVVEDNAAASFHCTACHGSTAGTRGAQAIQAAKQ